MCINNRRFSKKNYSGLVYLRRFVIAFGDCDSFFSSNCSGQIRASVRKRETGALVSRVSHVLSRYDRKPALPIRNVECNYDRRRVRVQLIRDKFCRSSGGPTAPPRPQKKK